MSFRNDFKDNLPVNSGDALCELGDRTESWLNNAEATNDFNYSQARYILALLVPLIIRHIPTSRNKFDEMLDPLTRSGVDYHSNIQNIVDIIIDFAAERDSEKLLAILEDENLFGVAELTPKEKEKAHGHLNFIRSVIEKSNLDAKKKNALFDKLNKLSKEIDKIGTKTDQFFGFVSDLGLYLGEFGKDSKPLCDRMNETLRILTKSRAKKEGIALPKNENMPQLPAPESDEEDK